MSYDAENRPLSVTHNDRTTAYVYGADGSRLKKQENAGTATQRSTIYLGPTEIRDCG